MFTAKAGEASFATSSVNSGPFRKDAAEFDGPDILMKRAGKYLHNTRVLSDESLELLKVN
jgi:hypothetical protein